MLPVKESLTRLDVARATVVMVRHAVGSDGVWSAKALVPAVHSLMRYLYVDERIPDSPTGAVPVVATGPVCRVWEPTSGR